MYLLEEEASDLAIATVELENFVRVEEVRFITGDRSIATFDEFVDQVKRLDLDRILSIYQNAYERQMNR